MVRSYAQRRASVKKRRRYAVKSKCVLAFEGRCGMVGFCCVSLHVHKLQGALAHEPQPLLHTVPIHTVNPIPPGPAVLLTKRYPSCF